MEVHITRMGEYEVIKAVGTPDELAEFTRRRGVMVGPSYPNPYFNPYQHVAPLTVGPQPPFHFTCEEVDSVKYNQVIQDRARTAYTKGGETNVSTS